MHIKNYLTLAAAFFLWLFLGSFLGWQWFGDIFWWSTQWVVNNSILEEDLLTVYTTGSLSEEWFTRLWLSQDKRFSLIQYCGHNYQYCQEAYEQQIDKEMIILMYGEPALDYYRHPFVSSLTSSDTVSWLGIWCADSDEIVDQLHSEFYTKAPQDLDDVLGIGARLWLWDEFTDCVSHWSALVYIAQSMQKGIEYFDISKVPSYVLIDNQSKHWSVIPGLYGLKELWEVMTRELDFTWLE